MNNFFHIRLRNIENTPTKSPTRASRGTTPSSQKKMERETRRGRPCPNYYEDEHTLLSSDSDRSSTTSTKKRRLVMVENGVTMIILLLILYSVKSSVKTLL